MGVRSSLIHEEKQDPQCIPTTSAIYVLEDVSIHPDVLIFVILSSFCASSIFTCVYADIASGACPSQAGCRAITSITFAAVICDADEPCSVNCMLRSRLSQCLLKARLFLCTSGIVAPT